MFKHDDLVPFVNDIKKHVVGFDNLWDDLVHRTYDHSRETFPKDNMYIGENEVIIILALAGYDREDIKVERNNNILEISGASNQDNYYSEDYAVARNNIAFRSFTKRYTVAAEYKDIEADFTNGILKITLKREPKEAQTQLIEIK